MNKINDGGPAFPVKHPASLTDPNEVVKRGMSLRDWFAGQIVAEFARAASDNPEFHIKMKDCAEKAYRFADAMLRAREKPEAV